MIIEKIKLNNFRCHDFYELKFQPDTTLILGPNGCGKTSVLEAIYLLMQGKSFRVKDEEFVKRETKGCRAELDYENGENIILEYNQGKKIYTSGDRKTIYFPANKKHPVVLFEPKDLNLVSAGGADRLAYFDRFFSQLSSDFAEALSRYKKAQTQRNKLLKDENVTLDTLFPWGMVMAKNGLFLSRNRKAIIEKINTRINQIYHSIAENEDEVRLDFSSEVSLGTNNDEVAYLKNLEKNFEKDKIIGYTTFGTHKERVDFIFNQVPASGSASRGETRSIILALKFIEAKLLTGILHEKPVILLDDVFSELDSKRRKALVENFKDHQVVITSVEEKLD